MTKKKPADSLGWIEAERSRIADAISAGLKIPRTEFEPADGPEFYFVTGCLALGTQAYELGGQYQEDLIAADSGQKTGPLAFRKIAIRRIVGRTLLELNLLPGARLISTIPNADTYIQAFCHFGGIEPSVAMRALTAAEHVQAALQWAAKSSEASEALNWPKDGFFAKTDEIEEGPDKDGNDPWPRDCAREAVAQACFRALILENKLASPLRRNRGKPMEALRDWLKGAAVETWLLKGDRSLTPAPSSYKAAERIGKGKGETQELTVDVIATPEGRVAGFYLPLTGNDNDAEVMGRLAQAIGPMDDFSATSIMFAMF